MSVAVAAERNQFIQALARQALVRFARPAPYFRAKGSPLLLRMLARVGVEPVERAIALVMPLPETQRRSIQAMNAFLLAAVDAHYATQAPRLRVTR